jgi:hypothetical protein
MLVDPFLASSLACPLLGKGLINQKKPVLNDIAVFNHSIWTQANAVKFAHQSLYNPKISTLLKYLCKGFLKGCPNLNEELVIKYLNPNPATAKGHMKGPKKSIQSMTIKCPKPMPTHAAPVPVPNQILPLFDKVRQYPGPVYNATRSANVIPDDESIVNMVCFGAFHNSGNQGSSGCW